MIDADHIFGIFGIVIGASTVVAMVGFAYLGCTAEDRTEQAGIEALAQCPFGTVRAVESKDS